MAELGVVVVWKADKRRWWGDGVSGYAPLAARVVSGLFFFPRGGSAQVARELGRALRNHGFALIDEDAPAQFEIPISVLAGRRDRLAGYLAAFNLCQRHPDADFGVLAAAGRYPRLGRRPGMTPSLEREMRTVATRGSPGSGLLSGSQGSSGKRE